MAQIIDSSKFEEIIDKIKENMEYYERGLIDNKIYLGLANGDNINLTFPRNNIAHVLGVHVDKLRAANIVKMGTSSYDILKKLVDCDLTYASIRNANSGFNISTLFSDYIDEKLRVFKDVLKLRTDEIYAIVKYCTDRTYTTGEEKENSDYFIIRKHNGIYSVLGIVKNEGRNDYVPVTSRVFTTQEELGEFLNKVAKNQEVTYPWTYRIENYSTEFDVKGYTNLEEKLTYNRNLKDIAFKYKAIPSTNRDFIALIDKFLNNRQKNNNNSSILSLIKDSITSGNIIDKEEVKQMLDGYDIPYDLDSLINACNDMICAKSVGDKSVGNSYSSIQDENTKMRGQLETLKKELLELQSRNTALVEENKSLKESNDSNLNKLKILSDAFEKIK